MTKRVSVRLLVCVELAAFLACGCGRVPGLSRTVQDVVKQGDVEKVRKLIEADPALVYAKDERGLTMLHWAALLGRKKVAELLLDKGADVNSKDERGRAPLDLAIQRGDEEVVALLRQHGGKETEGATLDSEVDEIQDAAREGDAGKVRQLLKVDPSLVNVRDKDTNYAPLHLAVLGGHLKVMDLLLSKDAAVNAKDKNGRTPLALALRLGNQEVVDFLREHGGN